MTIKLSQMKISQLQSKNKQTVGLNTTAESIFTFAMPEVKT